MDKIISATAAVKMLNDGDVVMFGGFLGNGSAHELIGKIGESSLKDLTLVSNDTGYPTIGTGILIGNQQIKKIMATHIGTNPVAAKQMFAGTLDVELIPQGTLAERIRAAGYGLGGILTPTGIGTEVAKGKEVIQVDGKDYLLEKPLFADVAILYADKVDRWGNVMYYGSEQNFNHVMATAAKVTIVETTKVVEVGEIPPNQIHTPGVLIDYIVERGGKTNG